MAVFDGVSPEVYLKGQLAHYRNLWLTEWAPRYRNWQRMLEPTRAHKLGGFKDPYRVRTRAEADLEAESQIVTTWARSAVAAITARYLTQRPVWRVITDEDPGNQVKAEALAPYALAVTRALDADVVARRLGYSWDFLLKASMTHWGKVVARPGVVTVTQTEKDGKGRMREVTYVRPVCPLINPSEFYHDIGKAIPAHYFYERKLTLAHIRAELADMRLQLPAKLRDR